MKEEIFEVSDAIEVEVEGAVEVEVDSEIDHHKRYAQHFHRWFIVMFMLKPTSSHHIRTTQSCLNCHTSKRKVRLARGLT